MSHCPGGTCKCGEVGVDEGCLPHRADLRHLLAADLAELRIVEHDVGHVHVVLDQCGDLGEILSQPAVAGDRDDRPSASGGGPGTERRRKGESDRSEVPRHENVLVRTALEVVAEGIGVVADVNRKDRIPGYHLAHHLEHGCGMEAAPLVGQTGTTLLLLPPPLPPRRKISPDVGSVDLGDDGQQLGDGSFDLAPQGDVDRMELAERHPIEVHLDGRLVARDPGVIGERRPQHQQCVASPHHGGTNRGPGASQDPRRQGVPVRHEALGLEGGDDRGVQVLCQGDDRLPVWACAVAGDDRRALCPFEQPGSSLELMARGSDPGSRQPALHRSPRGIGWSRHVLHFVGEDQMGDIAVDDGVLQGERHQLGRVLRV